MFRTTIGKRTARGMAVGALILSLSATTLGGSASAAPAADETTSCSALAHARNESVHRLHDKWKGFRDQLKDLAKDARELERDARHSKSATELIVDARSEVADARAKLQEIWTSAHEKLQNGADLGQACKAEDKDEDTKTSSNTTANTTTTTTASTTKDEDKDEDKNEDKNEDKDEHTQKPSITTASMVALVAKYKDVVDQAIKDMQAVLDDVTATVAKMTTAAQSTDASLAAKVKADRAKEKDARNSEHDRSTSRGTGKGSRG